MAASIQSTLASGVSVSGTFPTPGIDSGNGSSEMSSHRNRRTIELVRPAGCGSEYCEGFPAARAFETRSIRPVAFRDHAQGPTSSRGSSEKSSRQTSRPRSCARTASSGTRGSDCCCSFFGLMRSATASNRPRGSSVETTLTRNRSPFNVPNSDSRQLLGGTRFPTVPKSNRTSSSCRYASTITAADAGKPYFPN